MKIYLVGGAVRDYLLNIPVTEKDWVVVGSGPEEMISQGFKPVGKGFPVFIHPKNGEEYALARTEKKISKGYHGFSFYTDKSITLVEDLKRRDLTINAMAMDNDGCIIDPFHGQEDLKRSILRHVSPSFVEDPVRVLRTARFAARFGFQVHESTISLIEWMVGHQEVDSLVPERVWRELSRALMEKYPLLFFELLYQTGALKIILPELMAFKKQNCLQLFKSDVFHSLDLVDRYVLLTSYLNAFNDVVQLNNRLNIPKETKKLSELLYKYSDELIYFQNHTARDIVSILMNLDAYRREKRFYHILDVLKIKYLHQENPKILIEEITNQWKIFLKKSKNICYDKTLNVDKSSIAEQIKLLRISLIEELK